MDISAIEGLINYFYNTNFIVGLLFGGFLTYRIVLNFPGHFLIPIEKRIACRNRVRELYTDYKNKKRTLEEIQHELLNNLSYIVSIKDAKRAATHMHILNDLADTTSETQNSGQLIASTSLLDYIVSSAYSHIYPCNIKLYRTLFLLKIDRIFSFWGIKFRFMNFK